MTIVVSDTSPLNYLILIGAVDLLPRLFSEVYIPPAVAEELSQPRAPALVRDWMAAPPAWLQVKAPRTTGHAFDLDTGEAQAILLAQELGTMSFLVDERKGFAVAESQGLEPIELLGILELCASKGWIDFEEHVRKLRATTFRFHEALIAEIRARLLKTSSDEN